eukprot:gene13084-15133_t
MRLPARGGHCAALTVRGTGHDGDSSPANGMSHACDCITATGFRQRSLGLSLEVLLHTRS